jgi:hypothetical protein
MRNGEKSKKLNLQKDVVKEFEAKMYDVTMILNEKESAFKVMQQEFLTIKDFRVWIIVNKFRGRDKIYCMILNFKRKS